MKIILLQNFAVPIETPGEREFIGIQEKLYGEMARPGTQITAKIPTVGMTDPDLIVYPGARSVNDNSGLVKSMVEAEKEGADAIVVNCWFDPGVSTAKQLIDIPVVGVCETSLHLASTMGSKFAVVTSQPEFIPTMEEQIYHYRMNPRVIAQKPVRATKLGIAEEFESILNGNYEPVCKDFIEIARGCIEDEAEVIICGCALLAPLLTLGGLNDIDGVPVLNPVSIGIKWAEMLVDLKRLGIPVISRKGINLAPAPGVAESLLNSICKEQ
jgi:allantoin racemase